MVNKTEKPEPMTTTIKIRPTTRANLAAIGAKGQTYDDIICYLLDQNAKATQ